MVHDLAFRVLSAFAGALASERRRTSEMLRALAIVLALVTTPSQRRTSVTLQTSADWHLVDHLALCILSARTWFASGFYIASNISLTIKLATFFYQ